MTARFSSAGRNTICRCGAGCDGLGSLPRWGSRRLQGRDGRRMADVCALLERGAGSGWRGRSGIWEAGELLSVHASGVAADLRLADGGGGCRVRGRCRVPAAGERQPSIREGPRTNDAAAMARIFDGVRVFSAGSWGAGIYRSIRHLTGCAYDLRRRELYRCAHPDYRYVAGGAGADPWRGDRGCECGKRAARPKTPKTPKPQNPSIFFLEFLK